MCSIPIIDNKLYHKISLCISLLKYYKEYKNDPTLMEWIISLFKSNPDLAFAGVWKEELNKNLTRYNLSTIK